MAVHSDAIDAAKPIGGAEVRESALSDRQLEIMRSALSVGGKLSEQMHEEFWSEFDGLEESELTQIQKRIEALAPEALSYQRALWRAAEISLRESRVTYTDELTAELEKFKTSHPKVFPTGAEQAKALLEAAANQTPLKKGDGSIFLTEEMISEVLEGLDGSISRFKQLSNREWASRDGI